MLLQRHQQKVGYPKKKEPKGGLNAFISERKKKKSGSACHYLKISDDRNVEGDVGGARLSFSLLVSGEEGPVPRERSCPASPAGGRGGRRVDLAPPRKGESHLPIYQNGTSVRKEGKETNTTLLPKE